MSAIVDRLERAWSRVEGWPYGGPRFPSLAPGMPAGLQTTAGTGALDCSSLTAWLLLTAYPRAHEQHPGLYADLQVFDHARPWSPIEGAILAGIAVRAIEPADLGTWYLLQSWRGLDGGRIGLGSSGHARIALVTAAGLRVWEATTRHPPRVRASTIRGTGDIPGTTQCAALDTRDPAWNVPPGRKLG